MGINFKTLKWLEKNIDKKNLSMAVIGRQSLNLKESEKKKIDQIYFDEQNVYADYLLKKKFNLSKLISFDKSNYEECDVVINFENNFDYNEKFDIFFDGGSLQHIYNIPKAINNIIKLTKINGKIIHTVTFNNFQGFGLYQISPELLSSIYSEKNGFSNTSLYLVTNLNDKYWYRIKSLDIGEYFHFNTNDQLSIYLVTTKKSEVEKIEVNQKFYLKSNLSKNNYLKEKFINFYLYLKIILLSIFTNFFLKFDKKLKKEKIE